MGRSYFLGHSTFCRPPPAEPSTTAPATLPSQGSASGVTKLGMPNDVVADAAGAVFHRAGLGRSGGQKAGNTAVEIAHVSSQHGHS